VRLQRDGRECRLAVSTGDAKTQRRCFESWSYLAQYGITIANATASYAACVSVSRLASGLRALCTARQRGAVSRQLSRASALGANGRSARKLAAGFAAWCSTAVFGAGLTLKGAASITMTYAARSRRLLRVFLVWQVKS